MPEGDLWNGLSRGEAKLFRADSAHDLLYGLDTEGRPTLILRHGQASPSRGTLPELRGVKVVALPVASSRPAQLIIRLTNPDHRDLFENLCCNVAGAAAAAETEKGALTTFITRLHRWHALLRRGSDRLSKREQMGLVGELLFLERVSLELLDPLLAVETWQGPLDEPKDFAFGSLGVECKARSASGRDHVHISSEDQLDLQGLGSLYLHVVDLAEAPAEDRSAGTLRHRVEALRARLSETDGAASEAFNLRLESLGYQHEDDYSEHTWLAQDIRVFDVREDFPSIRPGAFHAAVSKVNYQVDLAHCAEWLVDIDELGQHLRSGADT